MSLSTHPSLTFPYARPCLDASDEKALIEVLRSSWLTRGPKVARFEEAIAQYVGVKHVITFCNASAALWSACSSINASPSDELLVPTNTFVATATCGMQRGCALRLLEIDPQTGNLDLEALAQLIKANPTEKRRIFLPVHFAGVAIDMAQLAKSVQSDRDIIIEDASHAIGSCYPTGEKVGSCAHSDMTIFSFHANKNICCGEGGAVCTNNSELAYKLRALRNSGIKTGAELKSEEPWYYEVEQLSCQMHMNEMQAALGLSQLARLEAIGEKKAQLIEAYREKLPSSVELVMAPTATQTHYHLAVALIDFKAFQTNRSEVMHALKNSGIGTQVHYIPLYRHPVIANYPHLLKEDSEKWQQSEEYYSRALSLPLFTNLTSRDVDFICEKLARALRF